MGSRFTARGLALAVGAVCALGVVAMGSELPQPQVRTTALRFGGVVTGLGPAIRDAVVVIEGDRIVRAGSGDRLVPAGAEVIDLRPLIAIPGLIDAHTHMTYFWIPPRGPSRCGNRGGSRRRRSNFPRRTRAAHSRQA